MLKKLVIGALSVTIVGAVGSALVYQSMPAIGLAASEGQVAAEAMPATSAALPTATPEPAPESDMGDPWTMTGTISALDDFGLTLVGPDGISVYVELGPPAFWQSQGVALTIGETVTVNGYASEGMYHAATVTTIGGQQMTVRNEYGQPLWSGGIENGAGQNGATNTVHTGTPQPQAQVDEWITFSGTITAMARNMMTVQTDTGETLNIQMGKPSFAASQGITFAVGDAVTVVGFWEGTNFNAGDITQMSTGLRLMLRDPNGRPLWAGPGNGNGNGAARAN
ncbi:MAG: hypothetical protein IT326_04485 [Anaerolineae bacterium]|nr:hypothetical protein [Anaerolineae bacterium]